MDARTLLAAVVVACASASSTQAQEGPLFAGRWTLEPDSTAANARGAAPRTRGVGSGWGTSITIAQDAKTLTVEYMFFTRGDMQPPLRFVYALDGTETRHAVMMGRGVQQQSSRTAWSGDSLIITTTHWFPHPDTGTPTAAEVKRVLTLATPDSLIVHTTLGGVLDGPPSTSRALYRRAQ